LFLVDTVIRMAKKGIPMEMRSEQQRKATATDMNTAMAVRNTDTSTKNERLLSRRSSQNRTIIFDSRRTVSTVTLKVLFLLADQQVDLRTRSNIEEEQAAF